MPTMFCQQPVPKQSLGTLRTVEPSKPELNKSFAEGFAGAGDGGGDGVGDGAGDGAGDVTPVGGEGASLGDSDTFASPHPASRLMTAIAARSSNKRWRALRRLNPPAGCAGKPRDALRFQFMKPPV